MFLWHKLILAERNCTSKRKKGKEEEQQMPWPSELVLVRHAESEGNILSVNERASFNLATHAYPLTKKGRRQAIITGQF
ncbi:MAG: hypothetical protein AAB508_00005, partial [Patescibacteria group bacterium]